MPRKGGVARAFAVDIADLDAVTKTFAAIEGDLGPVGLLTNNAGSFAAIGPIWTVEPEAWWRDIEINIRGTFNCCRAAIPAMMARGRGRIIIMTGGGTATSFPSGSGYATSKAGLLRFTECVSDSLAGSGVLVFAMDPGLVRTAMTEYQLTSEAGRTHLPNIPRLFEAGVDVPPALAARLSVEIGSGRFDRLAGRMLMAARGDLDLGEAESMRSWRRICAACGSTGCRRSGPTRRSLAAATASFQAAGNSDLTAPRTQAGPASPVRSTGRASRWRRPARACDE